MSVFHLASIIQECRFPRPAYLHTDTIVDFQLQSGKINLEALFALSHSGHGLAQELEQDLRFSCNIPAGARHWRIGISHLLCACHSSENKLMVSFVKQLELWVANHFEAGMAFIKWLHHIYKVGQHMFDFVAQKAIIKWMQCQGSLLGRPHWSRCG